MMELCYYGATNQDVEPIFCLCKALIDTYEDVGAIEYDKVLGWVRNKIQCNIDKYTVVNLDGNVVGYYCLDKQEEKWELDDFYILPAYRNRGIGSAVLQNICEKTVGSIFLYVFTQNSKAIRLYSRFGFQVVQKVSNTRQIMERPG